MIDANTLTVYVRVDLKTQKVVSLSDELLPAVEGRPVFTLSANDPDIKHYIVEADGGAEHGVVVRVSTNEESTTIDEEVTARIVSATAAAKYNKAFAIKVLYDEQFIRRFRGGSGTGFMTTTEALAAFAYEGADENMINNVVPLARLVNTLYNEWRHGEIQTVINTMVAAPDMGIELDADHINDLNDVLDQFLADHGIDILIYHR